VPERGLSGGERAVRGHVVFREGVAGVPAAAGQEGRGEGIAQVVPVPGQRQGRAAGRGHDGDEDRRHHGQDQVVGVLQTGHYQGATDRPRVPVGHTVQRHQRHTHVHGGHIQTERQPDVAGHVRHPGGRGPGVRVCDRFVCGEPRGQEAAADRHVPADRGVAGHHRLVFPGQPLAEGRRHRSAAGDQPVHARGGLFGGPGHGAVHHLRGDIPRGRAQQLHVRADVLEQRAGLRRGQGVPADDRENAPVRMLLPAERHMPGHRAVHVHVRARDQGQDVRRDPGGAARVVPGRLGCPEEKGAGLGRQ